MSNIVEVAAAILLRGDGSFLLAQRPSRTVYAGYWEFPGGKVERGESATQALIRELHEEIGVDIERADPWIAQTYVYPHATVRIHFFRVRQWRGEMHGREGQALAWAHPERVEVEPLLPANAPVLRALRLPDEYAVSNAGEVGERAFFGALERRLAGGLKLLQLREKNMDNTSFKPFAERAIAMARTAGARVVVNGSIALARATNADGVQLSASQLAVTRERPDFPLVGASVHGVEALRRAEQLGADFAVLGSVAATPTHPQGKILGWDGFADIVAGASIPVYAIGGVRREDLDAASRAGAQGVAMIRGSWS